MNDYPPTKNRSINQRLLFSLTSTYAVFFEVVVPTVIAYIVYKGLFLYPVFLYDSIACTYYVAVVAGIEAEIEFC